ncbi:hypothetical protein [Nonomuraea sp. SBT364]|uniref:hypothetical protein n=1 Tax=Nonomuraea sp. SBT364 TaxID=1580530 RepID=UPI00066D5D1C|nr:hypothetical protein [Nonomuraea sp. SBT364]
MRRRNGPVIGGVMAICLLTGCSGLPGLDRPARPEAKPSTPSATPTPASPVSTQEATAVLDDYIKRNNAANKARSTELLAGYEAGSSFVIDQAAYNSSRILHKKTEYVPFGYAEPAFHAPAPTWFLATALWKGRTETAKTPTYLLFTKEADGWRQVYAPDVFTGVGAAPEIATPVTEVKQADATGLLMSPADFAKGYAAHLGGKSSTRFAADRLTTSAASNRSKMDPYAKLTEAVRPASRYPSYALRTADGGALVFTTFQRARRYDVRQGPQRNYVFQKNNGLIRGKFYTFLKVTDLVQVAAHIPPKTAEPAQVKVIGSYSGIISGSGS